MKKKDVIVIVAIALIAASLAIWLNLNKNTTIHIGQVYYKDEVIFEFDIHKDERYHIDGSYGSLVLEVTDRSWRITDEDCPNHICSKLGWISSAHYLPITCIPNDVMVTVNGING